MKTLVQWFLSLFWGYTLQFIHHRRTDKFVFLEVTTCNVDLELDIDGMLMLMLTPADSDIQSVKFSSVPCPFQYCIHKAGKCIQTVTWNSIQFPPIQNYMKKRKTICMCFFKAGISCESWWSFQLGIVHVKWEWRSLGYHFFLFFCFSVCWCMKLSDSDHEFQLRRD